MEWGSLAFGLCDLWSLDFDLWTSCYFKDQSPKTKDLLLHFYLKQFWPEFSGHKQSPAGLVNRNSI
jgi:hypothetical protein